MVLRVWIGPSSCLMRTSPITTSSNRQPTPGRLGPMNATFDLQSHSTYSDGELRPAEVVAAASDAGIELFALTDHDTVDGVEEAIKAAAETNLRLVPAIEFSIIDDSAPDIHVLGYGIDHRSGALLSALARFRADRAARADRMIDRMRSVGFVLDPTTIQRRRAAGLPIGRPHLAEAVLSANANAPRLANEQIATVSDLVRAYLVEGKPGFARRSVPTAGEAIDVIHCAGGLAVWAHPFWDVADPKDLIDTLDRYCKLGLDGVEVFYLTHKESQIRLLHDAATKRRLLCTGSSDFHGPNHPLFARLRAFALHGLQPDLGRLAECSGSW